MDVYFTQSYSGLFILGSLAAALIVTYLLYQKPSRESLLEKKQKWFLAAIRFIAFSLIAILLSQPVIKRIQSKKQKSIVIVAVDNSESMHLQERQVQRITEQIKENLKDNELIFWQFGEQSSPSDQFQFDGKESDYSDLFQKLTKTYLNANIGAVCLLGDGIFNRGNDPAFQSRLLPFSAYTIGLGDTTLQLDAAIKNVSTNRTVYLHNYFPVEINLDFSMAAGKQVRVDIEKDGEMFYSTNININSNQLFHSEVINLKADNPGINNYQLKLSELEGETNLFNNVFEFSIEVISEKQNILLLADGAHPDLAALQNALKNNPSYSIELINGLKPDIRFEDYSLIIAHQLPNKNQEFVPMVNRMMQSQRPVLFIVGKESSISKFNSLHQGVKLQNNSVFENTRASVNQQFSLFKLDPDIKEAFEKFPPLSSPFGDILLEEGYHPVIFQNIQNTATTNALIALGTDKKLRRGFILGNGIWHWRLYDYLQNGNHTYFDSFIQKIINYLIIKPNEDNFNIYCPAIFQENEPVNMQAELFNASNELINTPDIELQIIAEDSTSYQFIFDKLNLQYQLNAGRLPVGNYTYHAKTELAGEQFSEKGTFRISPAQNERLETRANFQLLNQIALNTGGKFFTANETDRFIEELTNKYILKHREIKQTIFQDFLDIKWFFLLIVFFLGLEWFLRRFWGTY